MRYLSLRPFSHEFHPTTGNTATPLIRPNFFGPLMTVLTGFHCSLVSLCYHDKLRKVTIRKFEILYFRNERRHGTGNLEKDLFFGYVQPPIDDNSEDLANLMISL